MQKQSFGTVVLSDILALFSPALVCYSLRTRELSRFFPFPAPPKSQIMSLYLTTKIAQAVYLQENIFIFSQFLPSDCTALPCFFKSFVQVQSAIVFNMADNFPLKNQFLKLVSRQLYGLSWD